MMKRDRSITLHFIDGTKITFDFPEQTKSIAGKALRFEDFISNNNVLIEADGSLMVFPMANIKYVQFSITEAFDSDLVKLPSSLIRHATIRS
jgi:hypothetical protein